jgi:hypothetical protein
MLRANPDAEKPVGYCFAHILRSLRDLNIK